MRGFRSGGRLLVLVALATAVTACGRRASTPTRLDPRDLHAAERFRAFPVYWLGRSFEGLALTSAQNPRDYLREYGMAMLYGNCYAPPGGSCVVPLIVNSSSQPRLPLSSYGHAKQTHLRGVPAVVYEDGRAIELRMRRVTVTITGRDPRQVARALGSLRRLNRTGLR